MRSTKICAGYYRLSTGHTVARVVYPHSGEVFWNLVDANGDLIGAYYTKWEALKAAS